MKKGNIIDFVAYRDQRTREETRSSQLMSEELEAAIQDLIYKLRELGPIPSVK